MLNKGNVAHSSNLISHPSFALPSTPVPFTQSTFALIVPSEDTGRRQPSGGKDMTRASDIMLFPWHTAVDTELGYARQFPET